ncbi:HD domain-containing phosphohydrolase [uncultured Tissierella sp.]|uniref:HD domain-containing phosphohydrolase n=1 Tax=uncultured Tissierella sp. TaxID=448160 RepID=UPI002803D44B|nr:HD domain-containing phosphohydrolase [uncultured Tissierella sp.]MDU5081335.1 diguanylate cyclase [Bacillota bacterium]
MKIIQRKFYLFGILLTFIVAIGLVIQYGYLNNVITKDKELNMEKSIEHLGYQINSNLKYHSQYTVAASEFIATGEWSDKEVVEYFKRLVENNTTIRSIYLGDINNKLINSDNWKPPKDYDIKIRPWYIKAIEENKLVISDVYIDALENKLITTISRPIYNKNGELLGVVASDISMEEIIKIVEDTKIKDLGYSFLIDNAGNILAHPKYKYEFDSELININSISHGIHEKLKETKTGKMEVELDDVVGYLSYQPVEKTDWIIGNFMSLEEFRGNNNDIWRMLLIALIISMIIFISFTYLQKVNFLMPVYKLDKDIININIEGNIGYRIPMEKNDPFIDLRKSINFILNKTHEFLQQHEQDTEEIVAQNEELEASYGQLAAMEEEIRDQYEKLVKSEKDLKQALEKNKAIIEVLPDILFVINREGIFVEVEVADSQELYIEKEDFIGKKIKDLFSTEITEISMKKIKNVLENDVMETFEYSLEVPKGMENYEIRIVKLNEDEVVSVTRNITDKKKMEDKLIRLSYKDQLTGLYNRRFFEEELRRLDVPRNLPITIVMADVNGLKLINDSFGHKAGDELLKDIANIMKKGCREDDIIARISGDEFVIILPQTNEREAEAIIGRLKALSADEKFSNDKLSNMELSVSFGLGTKCTVDTDMSEILKKAEDNMYTHKLFEGPSMRSKTIDTIMTALYEKNKREEEHSKRVAMISQQLGSILGMKEEKLKELENVGLLHDIGKIAINEAILDKPGYLSDEEWEDMKKHPEIGYRILSTVNEMSQIAEYTLAHHERYDGRGYPRGLKGEEIPLVSRIIAIADSYDAMASDRSYRKALSNEEIIKEFIRNAGTQFDPQLARIFVEQVLKSKWIED